MRLWSSLIVMTGLVLPAAAEERADFTRDVMPLFGKLGCNGGKCHGSFQGRGGFRLSLFGLDPAFDYDAIVKEARGRRLNPAAVDASLLLRKPLGELPHGGGRRLNADSPEHQLLRAWIAQGLAAPTAGAATVSSLEIQPAPLRLRAGQSADLRVTAHWSDGVRRDVTGLALFESHFPQVATVSPAGQVQAGEPGHGTIIVRFQGRVASVVVSVPFAEPAGLAELSRHNFIDDIVAREWRAMGLKPAERADDYELCRRVYLDLIGTLPTPAEVRAFVDDPAVDKFPKLVDALLARPEYVDYWSLKWGDLLRVHRRYLGDKGLTAFRGWLRRALAENRPIDRLTREVLTARGNLHAEGPVGYFFVDQKPEEMAETTAQVFLGIRMTCARCHHHPNEAWSQDDYHGLANYFKLEVKQQKAEYGGTTLLRPTALPIESKRPIRPMPPHAFGRAAQPRADMREDLADWVTDPANPYFARNWANRYWSYLMGRGLVEPVDDLRQTNPASHPELLDALARDFTEHRFDVKHLLRTICLSRTYQLAAQAAAPLDPEGVFYAQRRPRRLLAEVLLDAVSSATGVPEQFQGVAPGTRAIALPDPSVPSYFLMTFGRPGRSSPCECARGNAPDLSQALHLLNSDAIQAKLGHPSGRLAKLIKAGVGDEAIIAELYLAAHGRPVSEAERDKILRFLKEAPSRQEGLEDVFWALLNSNRFLFNQ